VVCLLPIGVAEQGRREEEEDSSYRIPFSIKRNTSHACCSHTWLMMIDEPHVYTDYL
jgi:hypothetical protein